MNFNNWEILKQLGQKFLDTVEMAYVFEGNALFSTRDGKVYGVGDNACGCLGLGNFSSSGLPTEMKLSKKGVKGLASGGDNFWKTFLIAYLDSGEIFWWGAVPFPADHVISTPEKISIDLKIRVKTVACGEYNCAVLSDDGKVFTCGRNDIGQLGHEVVSKHEIDSVRWEDEYRGNCCIEMKSLFGASALRRVEGILEDQTVVDVSCGYAFTVVLLEDGRVAAWGDNDYGQLGINTKGGSSGFPVEVVSLSTFYGAVIEKIACGKHHVLALDKTGSLYAWGCNDQSQMGIPNVAICKMGCPMKVDVDNVRFTNIGASYLCHISAAQCEKGKVYIWGETTDGCVSIPTVTRQCRSINNVFVTLAKSKVMVQPIRQRKYSSEKFTKILQGAREMTLPQPLRNQRNSTDLTLIVDEQAFRVHKDFLKIESKFFDTVFTSRMRKNGRIFEIDELSFTATEAYLKFLYTDNFEVNSSQAVELFKLAVKYQDNELKSLCQNTIERDMKSSEVADIFALTRQLEDCQTLNRFSLEFALRNATEVMDSPGFKKWDMDTMRDFVLEYVKVKGNCP